MAATIPSPRRRGSYRFAPPPASVRRRILTTGTRHPVCAVPIADTLYAKRCIVWAIFSFNVQLIGPQRAQLCRMKANTPTVPLDRCDHMSPMVSVETTRNGYRARCLTRGMLGPERPGRPAAWVALLERPLEQG